MSVEFERLYYLQNAFIRRALHLRVRDASVQPFAILRSDVVPSAPFNLDYSSGTKPRDLIGTDLR